jgi:hypothetical protein
MHLQPIEQYPYYGSTVAETLLTQGYTRLQDRTCPMMIANRIKKSFQYYALLKCSASSLCTVINFKMKIQLTHLL